MTTVTISQDTLRLLVEAAQSQAEDLRSGVEQGYYNAENNADIDVLETAIVEADKLLDNTGKGVVALLSAQGTACAETALCGDEDTPERRIEIEAEAMARDDADAPIPGTWTDVSDNDALRGVGHATDE